MVRDGGEDCRESGVLEITREKCLPRFCRKKDINAVCCKKQVKNQKGPLGSAISTVHLQCSGYWRIHMYS